MSGVTDSEDPALAIPPTFRCHSRRNIVSPYRSTESRDGRESREPHHQRRRPRCRRERRDGSVLPAQGLAQGTLEGRDRDPAVPPSGCAAAAIHPIGPRLGFSLAEVSELLRLEDGTHCLEAMSLAERKLAEVHAKLTDLTRLERTLAKLVRACRARKGTLSCPLIASLHEKHNFAETAPSSAPPTASSCR